MKTLEKLFGRGCSGAFHVGGRDVALLLMLAFVAFVSQEARGYRTLGPERVLLMNNDGNPQNPVRWQDYGNTSSSNPYYWTHSSEPTTRTTAYLKLGITHTFYRNNGDGTSTPLWHLRGCRAGSGSVVGTARNYISWSSTAESIVDGSTNIPVPSSGAIVAVGSVVMRDFEDVAVYSPYYPEGIGVIYFDAVNAFVSETNHALVVQFATNAVEGVEFDANTSVDACVWHDLPIDVLTMTYGRRNSRVITLVAEQVEKVSLQSTLAADRLFYRVRGRVFEQSGEYRGPSRFRICRVDEKHEQTESSGFIIVDNIQASYPPMSVEMHQTGEYDDSLVNAEVCGYVGSFSSPFLSVGNTEVVPQAYYSCLVGLGEVITNAAEQFSVKNAKFYYRWRYLNQQVQDWEGPIPMAVQGMNLVGEDKLKLPDGVGDVEYYYTYEQDAPHYQPVDYAVGHVNGYGVGWTEVLTNRIYRANYPDVTPACGRDFFTRIREAESPCEWVKLCTSVTTNGTEGVKREDVRMELVGTNTWRYCYYVPTNAVGETLRFHFEGKKLFQDPDNPFKYAATTNVWRCDLSAMANLPYTSVAGEGYGNDVAVTLDGASTHLIIEFNDDLLSYSVSHGTYQNFNTWTDALVGYRGNAKYDEENPRNGASATGVSDTKKKFTAEMANWPPQGYSNPYWTENFNTHNFEEFPLYTPFDSPRYPKDGLFTPQNHWSVGKGQWIRGVRGSAAMAAANEEVALQLEGRGQGYVALDKDSGMPAGIGTVSFAARVAQEPRFDDFAVYGDGAMLTDYAISAKITMSRERTSNRNPTDISPSQPSVSLVGRYREKKGCYEYRITRIASDQLCCALYKWKPSSSGMVAHLLASNVITSA